MDADPHLTPEQLQALADARERAKGIFAAAKVAAFNGWSLAVFAVLTILFGLTSPILLALGIGLGMLARNELRGRDALRALDPEAPTRLVRNQMGLMALAVAYCSWSLYRTRFRPERTWEELETLAGLNPGYIQGLTSAGYAVAILATVLLVGLNARYYHRRKAMLAAYLDETPDWVVTLLKVTER